MREAHRTFDVPLANFSSSVWFWLERRISRGMRASPANSKEKIE
jgi:hypothetical protein